MRWILPCSTDMIRAIHISNDRRRDAQVAFDVERVGSSLRRVLPSGEEPVAVRLVKATVAMNCACSEAFEVQEPAQVLIDGDPDVDIEVTGRKLRRTHRVFVDKTYRIAYHVNLFRVVYNPDGTERERKELNKTSGNVNQSIPLRWTGRLFAKGDMLRSFVFTRSYQLRHVNGATFDFLYDMARQLADADAMVLVGAGKRGTDPILLSRGGQPYRGFLEGRIEGEKYCLILHLSDIELKGLNDETP